MLSELKQYFIAGLIRLKRGEFINICFDFFKKTVYLLTACNN